MKPFKDWSIRAKLVLPLFAVLVIGGGWIILALVSIQDHITHDALPQERALDGIRRVSMQLLGEYREFVMLPSDGTLEEITELKEEVEHYALAMVAEIEASFAEGIEDAERNMKRIGDAAVVLRAELLVRMADISELEHATFHTDRAENGDPTGHRSQSGQFIPIMQYLSGLRHYVMQPDDATLEDVEATDRSIQGSIGRYPNAALNGNATSGVEDERAQSILDHGRAAIVLTNTLLDRLEELEETEEALLQVLEEAGEIVALETDKAFKTGFASRRSNFRDSGHYYFGRLRGDTTDCGNRELAGRRRKAVRCRQPQSQGLC